VQALVTSFETVIFLHGLPTKHFVCAVLKVATTIRKNKLIIQHQEDFNSKYSLSGLFAVNNAMQ
jgi:hypothetical protein